MSKELLDFDRFTGTATFWDNEDGKDYIQQTQDVEPVIEHATKMRNDGRGNTQINGHLQLQYYLPNVVIMELKKKGINMMRPTEDDFKKCDKEIEQNYPYLKVAPGKLWQPK